MSEPLSFIYSSNIDRYSSPRDIAIADICADSTISFLRSARISSQYKDKHKKKQAERELKKECFNFVLSDYQVKSSLTGGILFWWIVRSIAWWVVQKIFEKWTEEA